MRKKGKYNLVSNSLFYFRQSWQIDKVLVLFTIAQIPLLSLLPFVETYLSKYVVQFVTEGEELAKLVGYISGMCLLLLLLRLTSNYLANQLQWRAYGDRFQHMDLYNHQNFTLDYELFESYEVQNISQKALNVTMGDDSSTQQFFAKIVALVSALVSLILNIFLLASFKWWLVVFLFAMCVLLFIVSRSNNRWVHKNKDNWVPLDRKISYVRRKAGDVKFAKDIRVFRMVGWFRSIFDDLLFQRLWWSRKSERRLFGLDLIQAGIRFLRDGLAYGYLLYQVCQKNLSVADFVFYFALIKIEVTPKS